MVKIGGRSKSSKSIIGGGDVHDGASTAVCSPAPYRAEQDDYIKPNAVQKTLFSAWETIKDNLKIRNLTCGFVMVNQLMVQIENK